ncbi:TPA: hypothetical protein NIB67_006780 [Pseudomonas aeruginosa]|nr:hypothetical protein [Pseudomonas aeruginosa]
MSIYPSAFCHECDAYIERDTSTERVPHAHLYDEEGTRLASFPARWSDEDILLALAFANRAFEHGVTAGKTHKIQELHRILELPK